MAPLIRTLKWSLPGKSSTGPLLASSSMASIWPRLRKFTRTFEPTQNETTKQKIWGIYGPLRLPTHFWFILYLFLFWCTLLLTRIKHKMEFHSWVFNSNWLSLTRFKFFFSLKSVSRSSQIMYAWKWEACVFLSVSRHSNHLITSFKIIFYSRHKESNIFRRYWNALYSRHLKYSIHFFFHVHFCLVSSWKVRRITKEQKKNTFNFSIFKY